MRVLLNIEFIEFNELEEYRSKRDLFIARVLKHTENLSLWKHVEFYGRWGAKKLMKFSKTEEVVKGSVEWKDYDYIISSGQEITPECGIVITPFSDSIAIKITIGASLLAQYSESIGDELVTFMKNIFLEFQEEAIIGPRMNIQIQGVDYARPRPPFNHGTWEPGCVVVMASRKFHEAANEGNPVQFEKIFDQEKEDFNFNFEFNDLIILSWLSELNDPENISKALSDHDVWFSRTLDLPVMGGYNELGDEMEAVESITEHKHLTFYDTFAKIGYKSILLNPDGTIDNDLLNEIQSWVSSNATPDGTSIKSICLLAPDRDSALKIGEVVDDKGIEKVLYVGKDNHWWNPRPIGDWIEV